MKDKIDRLLLITVMMFLVGTTAVEALELEKKGTLEVYQIKAKEEVLVEDNKILEFYDDNSEAYEEYKREQERIEKEEEERRQREEAERLARLEEERRAYEAALALQRQKEAEARAKEAKKAQESVNPGSTLGNSIVNYALQFAGNPYVYGGNSLTTGTDCSGFVMLVYKNFGISLPRTTSGLYGVGSAVSIENARPGDIVLYGYNGAVTHAALYIGNGQIIHAATPALGIIVDNMYSMQIVSIRRVA